MREKFPGVEVVLDFQVPGAHMAEAVRLMQSGQPAVESMVAAGVDLMELQIPFSEPTADGPAIVHANQKALQGGATVKDCLNLAESAARNFDIPFLLMSYFNIPFRYGVDRFVMDMSHGGLRFFDFDLLFGDAATKGEVVISHNDHNDPVYPPILARARGNPRLHRRLRHQRDGG